MHKRRTWRPAALIKLGIPRTRLLWWQEKDYAPATARSAKGGIAEYTARDALRAFLLHHFVEVVGFPVEVAAPMLDPATKPYTMFGKDFDRLPEIVFGTDEFWLVTPGIAYPATLAINGARSLSEHLRNMFKQEHTPFTLFGGGDEEAELWIPNIYLQKAREYLGGNIQSLCFFNLSAVAKEFASQLEIRPEDLR